MKRRRVLFVVGLLALIAGVIFLWPSTPTPFRLKIVRQAMEQGKPVVYFRVEGGPRQHIIITGLERVANDTIYLPVEKQEQLPSQLLAAGRQEFGISTPANASFWELRVSLLAEGSSIQRLQMMPSMWKFGRKAGWAFSDAARFSLGVLSPEMFCDNGSRAVVIESDIITNAVPEPAKPVDQVKP